METDCSFLDYSFINFAHNESLLTTSQYAKVIFHNIQEKYNLNDDLVCQYSLTEQFTANSGDRIVLFRLGWQQVTDYVLFEWATIPQENSCLEVNFKACSLPRDTNEFYQLCYISGENAVCGASVPFQFTRGDENLITSTGSECFVSIQMDSIKTTVSTSGISSQSESIEADTTIQPLTILSVNGPDHSSLSQLQEENKQLHNEIKKTNKSVQNCDSQLNELKHEITNLRQMLRVTQNDVSDLKVRMDLANEEYKKLYAEKTKVEKKYEKLVKKCQSKTRNKSVDSTSSGDMCDYLGELEPLPPFPLLM